MVLVCQKHTKKRRANETAHTDFLSEPLRHQANVYYREGEQKGAPNLLCKYMNIGLESLRKKEDIMHVLRRGARAHSPLFRLHFIKKDIASPKGLRPRASVNKTTIRLGVIVGKKVSKKAVERNRIRRRIREAFRRSLPNLHQNNIDVVMMPTREVLEAPFEGMIKEIKRVLK